MNRFREAVIRLTLIGSRGEERRVEVIVDTGFNGWVSLPPTLVTELGFSFRRRGRALLADGRTSITDIYEGTVLWNGESRRVPIAVADTDPLVGMSLLFGYELIVRVVENGSVLVRPLD